MDEKKAGNAWEKIRDAGEKAIGWGKKEWEREKEGGRIRRAVGWAAMGAMLCGETGYGSRILGTALLCAVRESDAAAAGIGCTVGAALCGNDGIPLLIAGAGVMTRRYFAGKGAEERFAESLPEQICLSCVAAMFVGVWNLVRGGVLFYDMFGLLLSLTLAPLLVIAYRLASDPEHRLTLRAEAGQALLSAAVVLAARHMTFFSFSVGNVLAVFLTLCVSGSGGALRGVAAGCLYGLMLDPLSSPALGLCGLLAGVLWGSGVPLACTAGMMGAVAVRLYTDGFSSLVSFAPDAAAGMLLALPLLSRKKLPPFFRFGSGRKLPEAAAARANEVLSRDGAQSDALDGVIGSLRDAAKIVGRLGDRMSRPETAELRRLCEEAFRPSCGACSQCAVCWKSELTSTEDALNRLVPILAQKGRIARADLPAWIETRCRYADAIVAEINARSLSALEDAVRRNRLGMLALDYDAAASLLADACARAAAESKTDEEKTRALRRTARYIGFSCGYLLVCGDRIKRVIAGGADLSRMSLSPRQLCAAFGKTLGVRLSEPVFGVEDDYVTMTMTAVPRIRLETAHAGCCREGEKMSGDSFRFFEGRDGLAFALISDGMGSGRDAALTSRMCAVFLETMLAAGNPKNVVLGMLNHFLRADGMECFATVDLVQFDLFSGRAGFLKSGAAPSFVLRNGRLFKLSSDTLPVGITREINAEEIRFDLEPGDLIVLLSDGIAHDLPDSLWLADLLSFDLPPLDPPDALSDLARRILCEAAERSARPDDMTVSVIRVAET